MTLKYLCLMAILYSFSGACETTSEDIAKPDESKEEGLSPESPLNKESLDLSKPLFLGETSLSSGIRNPFDGISGGGGCSACSR